MHLFGRSTLHTNFLGIVFLFLLNRREKLTVVHIKSVILLKGNIKPYYTRIPKSYATHTGMHANTQRWNNLSFISKSNEVI